MHGGLNEVDGVSFPLKRSELSELEKRVGKHDDEIAAIIEAIRQLIALPNKPLQIWPIS